MTRMPDLRTLALCLAIAAATTAHAADTPPWLDTSASFETRAAALVAQMTLEEKAAQMQNAAPAIERLGVPAYDWWSEGLHGVVPVLDRMLRFGGWPARLLPR